MAARQVLVHCQTEALNTTSIASPPDPPDARSKGSPSCPSCGSHQLERLVLVFKKVKWGPFLKDQKNCPFQEDCFNANSQRCNFCHRKYVTVRHFLSKRLGEISREESQDEIHYQFKDLEYYRKTEPFLEVWRLFELARRA